VRAFLVLGPESTGTRLATRILMAGGCHGSDGHYQPVGNGFGDLDPVVWRRSVPHNDTWPKLSQLVAKCGGREVHVVITVRDWWCTAMSQVAVGHAETLERAIVNTRRAYGRIFCQVATLGIPYTVLSYESFVLNPRETQTALLRSLGLQVPSELVVIRNENDKHWRTGR